MLTPSPFFRRRCSCIFESNAEPEHMKRILGAALSIAVAGRGMRSWRGRALHRRRWPRRRPPRPVADFGRVAEQGRSAREGPFRPRLDAEHQPHRRLRRRSEWLVRPGRRRPPDPALRQHDPRGADRRRPGRVRHQLPGRAHLRRRGRGADRLGDGHPPAHRPGDRGPRLVRHHPAEGPRRADLRGLRLSRTRSRRSRASSRPTAGPARSRP